ncbi:MAG TPA: [FeFe] hydrogenase H-cluster radical SAM maturase HydE, partial [Clostridia bacterium]
MKQLVDKLYHTGGLEPDEYRALINNRNEEVYTYLSGKAREVRIRHYGHDVYIRGLIEFTNYCRNDCYYCGIRKSNRNAQRYRLTDEQILECCNTGYGLGFRTFVLQGGEDGYYTDERIVNIIRSIKKAFPDCAVTLSIGERSFESYKAFYDAGADRYLLRHETADE